MAEQFDNNAASGSAAKPGATGPVSISWQDPAKPGAIVRPGSPLAANRAQPGRRATTAAAGAGAARAGMRQHPARKH